MKELTEQQKKRDEMLKKAVFLRKNGALDAAKAQIFEAIKVDPQSKMAFAILGEIAYLMNEQNLSLRCYLALTHLQLFEVQNSIYDNKLDERLKKVYDKIPAETLEKMPTEAAFIISLDKFITRQVGHALIDLRKGQLEEKPEFVPYAEIYRSQLLADKEWAKLLEKHNIEKEAYEKAENFTYIANGHKFLMDKIDWDKVFRNDVLNIYFPVAEGKK